MENAIHAPGTVVMPTKAKLLKNNRVSRLVIEYSSAVESVHWHNPRCSTTNGITLDPGRRRQITKASRLVMPAVTKSGKLYGVNSIGALPLKKVNDSAPSLMLKYTLLMSQRKCDE